MLATLEKWGISDLDVKSAFLYGTLDEEIYMEQPDGFIPKDKKTQSTMTPESHLWPQTSCMHMVA